MVKIAKPPPPKIPIPVHFTVLAGTRLLRMYDPKRFDAKPIGFRHNGPRARFDHNIEGPPQDDDDHGILYAGEKFSGCLVEIFGDTRTVQVGTWELTVFEVERDLMLLDLRKDGALKAGSVAALCKDSDHLLSQEWSRYFYNNEFLYQQIDGLVYGNAHNDETALALYERCEESLRVISTVKLADPNLRYDLLRTVAELNFIIEPYGEF